MAILNELPLELRQAILEYITAGAAAADGDKTHAHASYATVCQEWQAFFERDHFKRLVLSPLCIRDLDKRVQPGRRSLVKHIWLRIELPEHICRDRGVEDAKRDFDLHDEVVSGAIWELFSVLSAWEAADDGKAGLTLEISVHSPGDEAHFVKDHYFGELRRGGDERRPFGVRSVKRMDREREREQDHDQTFNQEVGLQNDQEHGQDGTQQSLTSTGCRYCQTSASKLFGRELCINKGNNVPPVPKLQIVTGFLMRRQYHRFFGTKALRQIFQSLPKLEQVNFEVWMHMSEAIQEYRDGGYIQLFKSWLPPTLKRLALFEDFDEKLHDNAHSPRFLGGPLGTAINDASRNLEELSAAFLVDAKDFFHAYSSLKRDPEVFAALKPQWEKLRTLSLTSKLLTSRTSENDINSLLVAAGYAAHRMPQLAILEIWYAQKSEAAVFRYEKAHESPVSETEYRDTAASPCDREPFIVGHSTVVSWRSSWEFAGLSTRVLDVWTSVARLFAQRELVVHIDGLAVPGGEGGGSYAGMLKDLRLRDRVLHPVSLHQVEWEAAMLSAGVL